MCERRGWAPFVVANCFFLFFFFSEKNKRKKRGWGGRGRLRRTFLSLFFSAISSFPALAACRDSCLEVNF